MGSKLAIHSPFGPFWTFLDLCLWPVCFANSRPGTFGPNLPGKVLIARTRAGILSTPLKLSNCSKKEKKKEKKEVNMLDLFGPLGLKVQNASFLVGISGGASCRP